MTNNSGTGGAMVTKFGQNMHNRKILKVAKYQVASICPFEAKKNFPVGGGGVDLPPPMQNWVNGGIGKRVAS